MIKNKDLKLKEKKELKDLELLNKNDNVNICYFNKNISKRPQTFAGKIISIKGEENNKSIKVLRNFNNDIIIQSFLYSSPNLIYIKKIK